MKIKILGTRGAIKPSSPKHLKHSGVLIDDVLLLDIGEKEYLNLSPKWIFITHLHPDHAAFITDPFTTNIPMYAPEPHINANINVFNEEIKVGPYTIMSIPTHHSNIVKSQGYKISKGKHSLLYTGDMIWIDKCYHYLLNKLDLVITEGSYLQEGGRVFKDKNSGKLYGHTGIPNLIHLFKPFARQILLVHFGSWFFNNIEESKHKISQLGEENQVNIRIGHDNMELLLNDG